MYTADSNFNFCLMLMGAAAMRGTLQLRSRNGGESGSTSCGAQACDYSACAVLHSVSLPLCLDAGRPRCG